MPLSKEVKRFVFIGILIALALAIVISPFASSWPDGLEKVAETRGFIKKGEGPQAWKFSPIPDYLMPGLGESGLATAAAGLVGTLIVFLAGWGLACLIRSRSNTMKDLEKKINRQ